jgi:hypothetical protein
MTTKKRPAKAPRDVNVNVHRIFEEAIRRSEEPPNRGKLKEVAPPPAKKNGATK